MKKILDGSPFPCFEFCGCPSHVCGIDSDSKIAFFHADFIFLTEFMGEVQSHHFGETGDLSFGCTVEF